MVNLREKPFYLDDEGVKWVEETLASMTLDEKVGQLFVQLKHSPDMEKALYNLKTFHQGGVRWQGGDSNAVYEQNKAYQENKSFDRAYVKGGEIALSENDLQYYTEFSECCSALVDDPRTTKEIKNNSSALLRLEKMTEEMPKYDYFKILIKLLNHENEKVRIKAMRYCLKNHILVEPVLKQAVHIVSTRRGMPEDLRRYEVGKIITEYALSVENE